MQRLFRFGAVAVASVGLYATVLAAPGPTRGENPLGSLVRDAVDATPMVGRVEQRLAAGSYSYLAVRSDDGALRWAVTLGRGAPPGTRVEVRSMGRRATFHSPRLSRTFTDLSFAIVRPLP